MADQLHASDSPTALLTPLSLPLPGAARQAHCARQPDFTYRAARSWGSSPPNPMLYAEVPMAEPKESLLKLANATGYFFQERLRDEIRQTYGQHGWAVVADEHRWSANGEEGFIDLILESDNRRMVIEAKRTRGGTWMFLVPDDNSHAEVRARCLSTTRSQEADPKADWCDLPVWPASPEAKFCVIRGHGDRDQPMLERLGGVLLRSTESLAEEELGLGKARPYGDQRLYFPTIVTNALMYVCFYDSAQIDLGTGDLPDGDIQQVNFIRFRKGLSTKLALQGELPNLKYANRAQERTIFVVHSTALVDVLEKWNP